MTTFRVHYYNQFYNEDGYRDIEANSPDEARAEFIRKHGHKVQINKIKVVRDE